MSFKLVCTAFLILISAQEIICLKDALKSFNLIRDLFFTIAHKYGQDVKEIAEAVLDSINAILAKFESFVQKFIDYIRDDHCVFVCRNGKPGKKNDSYVPTTKGCGFLGITIAVEHLPNPIMHDCCKDHDMCYAKCGSHKDECDDQFQECLLRTCKNLNNPAFEQGCRVSAKMVYLLNLVYSCKLFLIAQKTACICDMKEEL
ncbi:Group XIIA secretory phospholipase A2-like protein [Dinothrombium tinctorium]|uniref:Group XIIA secretory phospholipase A2-like protein n=1 Tax=Dinothrombium tinctorium TaxID=1965070 RepID=A0A3S3QPR4_9ACAR|nr:Group XIIA secretory phospholipase A2-like protein [Dinothrombium tinctorium]RWS07241.1 Group XIIA secretory phospholipase A2-like protein [Dinothrombium tinctorium]RWS12075.1 Group XIIA secretory phospholipase A2-like protein [Dinothrombium tinctorium]